MSRFDAVARSLWRHPLFALALGGSLFASMTAIGGEDEPVPSTPSSPNQAVKEVVSVGNVPIPTPALQFGPDGQVIPTPTQTLTANTRPELAERPIPAFNAGGLAPERALGQAAGAQGVTARPAAAAAFGAKGERPTLAFRSGEFVPPTGQKLQPSIANLGQARLAAARQLGGAATAKPPAVYGLILLNGRMDDALKARLEGLGVSLFGAYPNTGYRALLPAGSLGAVASLPQVRWVGQPTPQQKLALELQPLLTNPAQPLTANGVYVHFIGPDRNGALKQELTASGARIRRDEPAITAVLVDADGPTVLRMLNQNAVLYVDPVIEVRAGHAQSMASIGADWLGGVYDPHPTNVVRVGICDTGVWPYHQDFNDIIGGMLGYSHVAGESVWDDLNGHGTHCAGTSIGEGRASYRYRGVAAGLHSRNDPNNNPDYLVAQVLNSAGSGSNAQIMDGFTSMVGEWGNSPVGARRQVFNFSIWAAGTNFPGTDTMSVRVDDLFRKNVLPVVISGNGGPNASTCGIPGAAKGAFTVGNVRDTDHEASSGWPVGQTDTMAGDSGRGPTGDSRTKPDIVAPGRLIDSIARGKNNGYVYNWNGTSMAAPHVTGAAADLFGYFPTLPAWGAKSVLIANALDLGLPRNDQGWGKVDAWHSIYNGDGHWAVNWASNGGTGSLNTIDFNLPNAVGMIKIVLTWPDAPATAGASTAIKNDLDLKLDREPFAAGSGGDWSSSSVNNTVEVITVTNAPAGNYRIKIHTYNQAEGDSQAWAVARRIVNGSPTPNIVENLSLPRAVRPNTNFTASASATAGSYVATGVYGSVAITSGLSLNGLTYYRRSRPSSSQESIYYANPNPGGAGWYNPFGMNQGNIPAGATRYLAWSLRSGASQGINTVTYSTRSRNGGSGSVSGNVIVDGTPPSLHTIRSSAWGTDNTPDVTCRASDSSAGLNVNSAYYRSSNDGGGTWSGWKTAPCTGFSGTTSLQTITATNVAFGTANPALNRIQFYITDTAGNSVYSAVTALPGTTVQLGSTTFSTQESAGGATITVTRSGDIDLYSSAVVTPSNGTATTPADFPPSGVTVPFSPGETSRSAVVPIANDRALEGNENLNLTLGSPTGGTLGSPSSAVVTIADNKALPAPSGLTATVNNATSASLRFVDNCGNENRFHLEMSSDGGATWAAPIALGASAGTGANVSYLKTGLTTGATYRFRVKAVAGIIASNYSNVAQITIGIPAAPTNLTATAGYGPIRVDLKWTDASSNEARFYIYRRVGTGAWSVRGNVLAGVITFSDTSVAPGTTYSYRVQSWNGAGYSGDSNVATVTLESLPAAPSGLTSQVLTGPLRVVLNWTDGSSNETKFHIFRQIGSAAAVHYGTVNAGVTTFTDPSVSSGQTYRYFVRAWNPAGYSPPSGGTTLTIP